MRWQISLTLIVLMLAACASAPPSDPLLDDRRAPTIPPPAWLESADVITLENITRIQYLGRLDGPGDASTIFAHSLSPDGTRLAGLDNEQLLTWDLITGELVFTTARSSANHVYFSPDKTEVYTITSEGNATIYDAETGRSQNTFRGVDDYSEALAFYAEDGWLAFGSRRGTVRVWDPLERSALTTLNAHRLRVTALAFSDDGDLLATASDDNTVSVWDWRSGERLHSFDDSRGISILRFSPDAAQLAGGSRENVRLWSMTDDALAHVLESGVGGAEVLAYAPDGRYLVTGGTPREMSVWNGETGGLVARLPDTGGDRLGVAFSPDGSLLLTSVLGGRATLWNMHTITAQTVNRADLETEGLVFDVDWTSDNRLLTIFGTTGGVYVWGIG